MDKELAKTKKETGRLDNLMKMASSTICSKFMMLLIAIGIFFSTIFIIQVISYRVPKHH